MSSSYTTQWFCLAHLVINISCLKRKLCGLIRKFLVGYHPSDKRNVLTEHKNDIIDLPSAVETEQDILGTCLQEGAVWWRKVEQAAEGIDIIDLFFEPDHRLVARAMSSLYNNDKHITVSSVTDEVILNRESNNLIPSVQGYLSILQSSATLHSPDDVASAAKTLVEKQRLRELTRGMRDTIKVATTEQPNPNEIASTLRQLASEQSMMTTDIKTFGELIEKHEAESGLAVSVRASSGIKSLDMRLQGGFGSGSLSIIAARPKVGKTTVMLNAILANLTEGLVVVFASLELGYKELYSKLLSAQSMVPQRDIADMLDNKRKKDSFSPEDIEELDRAEAELKSALFYPLFTNDITHGVDTIIAAAWQAQQRHPDRKLVLYIDYAQLLVEGVANRTAEIGQMSRKLKVFAQEIDGPVIMAAQVNRDSGKNDDDGMPKPHQLRESGDLEQTADNVIMLNRKALQDETQPDHIMDVWLALVRTGEAGFCQAFYSPKIQYVTDLEEASIASGGNLGAEEEPLDVYEE